MPSATIVIARSPVATEAISTPIDWIARSSRAMTEENVIIRLDRVIQKNPSVILKEPTRL